MATTPTGTNILGQYIRDKRVAAGLSLRETAAAIGVSHVFLGEVERGIRKSIKKERLLALEQYVPGFAVAELERRTLGSGPLQLSLVDAPPSYQEIGLALFRRLEKRDLLSSELDELKRILLGFNDTDE